MVKVFIFHERSNLKKKKKVLNVAVCLSGSQEGTERVAFTPGTSPPVASAPDLLHTCWQQRLSEHLIPPPTPIPTPMNCMWGVRLLIQSPVCLSGRSRM